LAPWLARLMALALGHVSRARITQLMNLRLLCPRIQEEILFLPSPRPDSCFSRTLAHNITEVLFAIAVFRHTVFYLSSGRSERCLMQCAYLSPCC
jgi:hypothetical protein